MPLVEPFEFVFMQRALAEVVVMGVVCGVLGSLVLLRGLAYTGESMSHMLLPGAAAALLLGGAAMGGALVAGVLAAAAIAWLLRRPGVDQDTAIGVAVTAAFAIGVILLSTRGASRDLESLLFGSILAVEQLDLWLGGATAGAVLVAALALARSFVLVAFDRTFATATGRRPALLDLALLVGLALALAVALRGMGTLLVLSLLIAPAATARLLARRPWTMLALAPALAVGAGIVGLELSYYADLAAGPAIGLVAVGTFAAVAGVSGWQAARRRGPRVLRAR